MNVFICLLSTKEKEGWGERLAVCDEMKCVRALFGLQWHSLMPDCRRFKVAGVAPTQLKVCGEGNSLNIYKSFALHWLPYSPLDSGMHGLISEFLLFIAIFFCPQKVSQVARPYVTFRCLFLIQLTFMDFETLNLKRFFLKCFLDSTCKKPWLASCQRVVR